MSPTNKPIDTAREIDDKDNDLRCTIDNIRTAMKDHKCGECDGLPDTAITELDALRDITLRLAKENVLIGEDYFANVSLLTEVASAVDANDFKEAVEYVKQLTKENVRLEGLCATYKDALRADGSVLVQRVSELAQENARLKAMEADFAESISKLGVCLLDNVGLLREIDRPKTEVEMLQKKLTRMGLAKW